MSLQNVILNEPSIVKRILEFLQDDRSSLCSVGRTQRSLTEPASSLIYHTVIVNSSSDIEYLEDGKLGMKEVGNAMEWELALRDA